MGNNSVKVELKGFELLATPSPQISALLKVIEKKIAPLKIIAERISFNVKRALAPIQKNFKKLLNDFKTLFQKAINWAKSKFTWRFFVFLKLKQIPIKNPIPKRLWIPKELFFIFSRKLHAPPAYLPIHASSRTLSIKA